MVKRKETRGRKPVPESERTVQVQVYIKNRQIERVGGIVKAREIAKSAIEGA